MTSDIVFSVVPKFFNLNLKLFYEWLISVLVSCELCYTTCGLYESAVLFDLFCCVVFHDGRKAE